MVTDKLVMKTETVFSDDRLHRYLLRKEWDSKKPRATIIMTNPSHADLVSMDYTTLYILNNISKLDFGSVDIVNLSSMVSVKLNVKDSLDVELEKDNADYIVKSAERSDTVIIAWGRIGENNRKVRLAQESLLALLAPFRGKLFCIAASADGESGFHPLVPQIRFSWVLKEFVPPVQEGRRERKRRAREAPAATVDEAVVMTDPVPDDVDE